MEFGKWLSDQLGYRKMTMRELARASGISHSTISDIISGKREPTRKFCIAIAAGLSMTAKEVLLMADFKEDVADLAKMIEQSDLLRMINDLSNGDRIIIIRVIKTLHEQRGKYK